MKNSKTAVKDCDALFVFDVFNFIHHKCFIEVIFNFLINKQEQQMNKNKQSMRAPIDLLHHFPTTGQLTRCGPRCYCRGDNHKKGRRKKPLDI